MQALFGEGNFFIGAAWITALPEENTVLPRLIDDESGERACPWWLPTTAIMSYREDADAQEVLMCIQTGKTLEDEHAHAHGDRASSM